MHSVEVVNVPSDEESDNFLSPPPRMKRDVKRVNHVHVRESRRPPVKPVASECAVELCAIILLLVTLDQCIKELSEATRNYCRASIIGRGGYRVVYKRRLRYSTVAIKILTQVSHCFALFLLALLIGPTVIWEIFVVKKFSRGSPYLENIIRKNKPQRK